MTKEEYKTKLSILTADLYEKEKEYKNAQSRVYELKDEMATQVVQGFKQFIGKRVIVHYKGIDNEECCTVPGYLKKFMGFWGVKGVDDGVYPILYKSNKDGSPSEHAYSLWDCTRAEVQSITRIELIDTV